VEEDISKIVNICHFHYKPQHTTYIFSIAYQVLLQNMSAEILFNKEY